MTRSKVVSFPNSNDLGKKGDKQEDRLSTSDRVLLCRI